MKPSELKPKRTYLGRDKQKRKLLTISGPTAVYQREGNFATKKMDLGEFAALATADVTKAPAAGAVKGRR